MHWAHKVLLLTTAGVAVAGVLFRKTVYWDLPVAPGDPYGIGDIIDLGFALLLLFVAALTTLAGLIKVLVPAWRNPRTAGLLIGTAAASLVGYFVGHRFL